MYFCKWSQISVNETEYKQTPTYYSNKNLHVFKFIDLNTKVYLKKWFYHSSSLPCKKYSKYFLQWSQIFF